MTVNEAELQAYIKEKLNDRRYRHSLRTKAEALRLAAIFGVDLQKAAFVGLYHDMMRHLEGEAYLAEARRRGLAFDEVDRLSPILLHGPLAADELRRRGVTDEEILTAVAEHTLANADMSDLSKVLYLADKTEPGRTFAKVEELRPYAEKDLNQAMLLALQFDEQWQKEDGLPLHPQTRAALQYFTELVEKQKEEDKMAQADTFDSKLMVEKITAVCQEKKAVDIVALDLQGLSIVCDYFVIMTGVNKRHSQSLADYLSEEAKNGLLPSPRVEGYNDARWILMDFGSVIAHIFLADERQYYNLEKLWGDAPAQGV